MNASDDQTEPLGEAPDVPPRSAVMALLDSADRIARQGVALDAVRALHRPLNLVYCDGCGNDPDDPECQCGEGVVANRVVQRLVRRVVCEHCDRDEDGEWVDHPCATVRAIDEAGA